jgi:hypothetical protein
MLVKRYAALSQVNWETRHFCHFEEGPVGGKDSYVFLPSRATIYKSDYPSFL